MPCNHETIGPLQQLEKLISKDIQKQADGEVMTGWNPLRFPSADPTERLKEEHKAEMESVREGYEVRIAALREFVAATVSLWSHVEPCDSPVCAKCWGLRLLAETEEKEERSSTVELKD